MTPAPHHGVGDLCSGEGVELNQPTARVFGVHAHYFLRIDDVERVEDWVVVALADLETRVKFGVQRTPNPSGWSTVEVWLSEPTDALLVQVGASGDVSTAFADLVKWEGARYVPGPPPTLREARPTWVRGGKTRPHGPECPGEEADFVRLNLVVDGERRGAVVLADMPGCGVGVAPLDDRPAFGLSPTIAPTAYCSKAISADQDLAMYVTVSDGLGRRSNTVRVLVPALPRADANPSSTAPSAPRPR